jgi:hypothetical protein
LIQWSDEIDSHFTFEQEENRMKKIMAVLVILAMAAGIAVAKEYEVKKKAGDYDVIVKIDRNPPVVGDNTVTVAVKDAAGHHVKDAKVVIDYSMPAMPGMPPMNYKTDTVLKGDEYMATMGLSMSGSWNIAVKIMRAGKTSSMKFTVDAK